MGVCFDEEEKAAHRSYICVRNSSLHNFSPSLPGRIPSEMLVSKAVYNDWSSKNRLLHI